MAINFVAKTAPKVMERLYKESVTQGIFSNQFSWAGVKTIDVMSVDTVPLKAYDRTLTDGEDGTIGNRFGKTIELGDTKTSYTMQDEVYYNIGFEKSTVSDQMNIKTASSIISRQDREIVVPYRDQYRLKKLAEGAGIKKDNLEVTSGKIIRTLMTARADLANNLAPLGKQVIFVGETAAIEMKLADQVIAVDKLAEAPLVNGVVGKLAGMQLRIVPDVYMPKNCTFLIVTKGSAWAPVKVKTSRVITDPEDFDGCKVQYHEYHDCFVNEARKNTIYLGYSGALS